MIIKLSHAYLMYIILKKSQISKFIYVCIYIFFPGTGEGC